MVLIASRTADTTTNDVIDWLRSFEEKYLRINDTPLIVAVSFSQESLTVTFENREALSLSKVNGYWYRRGDLFGSKYDKEALSAVDPISLKLESEFLAVAIQKELESKPSLGSMFTSVPNKLYLLQLAQNVGLLVPPFLVTTQKSALVRFKEKHGAIITKPIKDSITVILKDRKAGSYTEELFDEDIAELNESFFPTLFQKKIDKKYEVRSFFLKGKIFSMAIFSQNNQQTAIDFRKYDKAKPNRNVPFQLPAHVEAKIKALMEVVNMDTGSIDIMVSQTGEYYFLEINPVGQIGFVSLCCNYFLEREIAFTLTTFSGNGGD